MITKEAVTIPTYILRTYLVQPPLQPSLYKYLIYHTCNYSIGATQELVNVNARLDLLVTDALDLVLSTPGEKIAKMYVNASTMHFASQLMVHASALLVRNL